MAILHLDRTNSFVDGLFRPLATSLTVLEAGAWLRAADADLSGFVEARWRVEPSAPVSVEQQQATKLRRLKAIAKAGNRVISRVESIHGMTNQCRAFLAR